MTALRRSGFACGLALLAVSGCGSEFSSNESGAPANGAGTAGAATGGSSAGSGGAAGAGGLGGGSNSSGGSTGGGGVAGGLAGGSAGAAGAPSEPCSIELLESPGFDEDRTNWVESASDDGAILYHGSNTLLIDEGVTAHSPDYLAWLGGDDDRVTSLSQQIMLPDGALSISVSGYYRVNTDESNEMIFDEGFCELVQGDTALALGYFTNQEENGAWTPFEGSIEASALADGMVSFQLRAEVDGSAVTNFFFDSLSVKAELCQTP